MGGVSIGDGGSVRLSIVADMRRRLAERRSHRHRADVPRHPRPAVKPRPDAQWDEAAGRWEVWSEADQGWVSLEDGSVQAPGTRSVDPHGDALLEPPPIDLH